MTSQPGRIAQAAADAASASAKATYVGGALSAVGGMALSNEIIAVAGLVLAILGWATQVWFGVRRDHREAEEHGLKMEEIRARMGKTPGAPRTATPATRPGCCGTDGSASRASMAARCTCGTRPR